MHIFGGFVLALFALIVNAFFMSWSYSTAWNMVIPQLFGVTTITMLQAYIASVVLGLMTHHYVAAQKQEFGSTMVQSISFSIGKSIAALLIALIVKTFFL